MQVLHHSNADRSIPDAVSAQPTAGVARPRSVYLETFGCQMNELDSELVRGHLAALGYRFVDQAEGADVVLYNTCSVREQAEQKVWSRLGIMRKRRDQADRDGAPRANFVLGVIGCMAEREGPAMLRKFPQIDLMCGPGELDKLPILIDNALKTSAAEAAADREPLVALQGNNHRRSSTLAAAGDNLEMLDLSRAFDPDRAEAGGKSAYVRITRGCNKFCTYCVVPFTRGAEVHRPPQSIVDECRKLADAGVIEVTLLGQTVNHYAYVHGAAVNAEGLELPQIGGKPMGAKPQALAGVGRRTTSFADLLRRIHDEAPAIQRLRFVTSYPRDFGDDALAVMRDSPRICRYLHVPAQSGSNRILKMMNRGYSVEQYIDFIDRARGFMPDVCIAGDIIVGFPSETDEDFAMTESLLRRVRCKNNFIFKYSPRPGTAAIERFEDDVPDEVKRWRNNQLLALQAQISAEVHREWEGRVVDVFVERISRGEQRGGRAVAQESHAPNVNGVELRWEKAGDRARQASGSASRAMAASSEHGESAQKSVKNVQMSGRTGGDLIAVFDLPEGASGADLVGQIVPVLVKSSGPLLLHAEVIHNFAHESVKANWANCVKENRIGAAVATG